MGKSPWSLKSVPSALCETLRKFRQKRVGRKWDRMYERARLISDSKRKTKRKKDGVEIRRGTPARGLGDPCEEIEADVFQRLFFYLTLSLSVQETLVRFIWESLFSLSSHTS